MSETDGQVVIGVKVDTKEVEPQIQKLQQKLAKQNETLERQRIAVERLTARYEELYEKAKQTAKPNIESEKILVEINKLEDKYKELQNLYNQAKLEPNIDQSKINEILSNLEAVDKKLIDLRKSHQEVQFSPDMQNKLKLLGQQIDIAIQKEDRLTNEVKATENEIDNLSKKRIDGVKDSVDRIKNSFENLNNKIKETQNSIVNYAKNGIGNAFLSIGNGIINLGKRIVSLGASAFVFNVISGGFRQLSNGIQSIIAHDNQLSNSLAQVKANLMTAFYPIYQAVLPAIRALGQGLSWVTGQIASFIAMITGTSIKVNQQGAKSLMAQSVVIKDQTKQLGKQAKGYDKVAKSTKKAKGELASFDKIEVLKTKKHTDLPNKIGNIGKGGNVGGIGKNIGVGGGVGNILKGFDNNTPKLLDSIVKAFERLKKPFENMDLSRLKTEFNNLWEILQRFGGKIGEGLWWFYENVLAPLAVWTISELLPRFLKLLASALEFLEPIIDQVGEDLVWLWDNFLKPAAEWTGSLITQFLDNLADGIKELGKKIKGNKLLLEFISAFLIGLGSVGVAIGVGKLAIALWKVVAATWAWTASLLANPVTWVVIGIASLIAIIILCVKHWDKIKEAGEKAWKKIEECWGNVKQWWNEKVYTPLVNFFDQLKRDHDKFWSDLGQGIKDKWGNIKKWFKEKIVDPIKQFFSNVKEWSGKAVEKIKEVWENVGKWFEDNVVNPIGNIWNSISEVWKTGINGIIWIFEKFVNKIIGGVNLMTGALSKVGFDVPEWLGGGHFGINIPKIPEVSIPRLAKGAVLEGGHPFLAMLNEQPKGQTNIETPLSTMIEAFKQANKQTNPNIVIEANGDFSQFIRMLNFKLKEEDARVGQSFVTGDVWV